MTPTPYQEARTRLARIAGGHDGYGAAVLIVYGHEPIGQFYADLRLVLSFPEGEREAVARVIDPSGWSYWDQFHDRHGHDYASQHIEPSLTKADRVINLLRGATNDI